MYLLSFSIFFGMFETNSLCSHRRHGLQPRSRPGLCQPSILQQLQGRPLRRCRARNGQRTGPNHAAAQKQQRRQQHDCLFHVWVSFQLNSFFTVFVLFVVLYWRFFNFLFFLFCVRFCTYLRKTHTAMDPGSHKDCLEAVLVLSVMASKQRGRCVCVCV